MCDSKNKLDIICVIGINLLYEIVCGIYLEKSQTLSFVFQGMTGSPGEVGFPGELGEKVRVIFLSITQNALCKYVESLYRYHVFNTFHFNHYSKMHFLDRVSTHCL